METNRKIIGTPFETKMPNEVSWTQENPKTSLISMRHPIRKSAKIIDIGGDSKLVDYLLEDMKTSLFWTFRQKH
jgi:hypothetical protein